MYRQFILLLVLLMPLALRGQHTLSGTITSKPTGETLIGATIYNTTSGNGAVTDVNGRFSLTIKEKQTVLRVNFVGHDPIYDTVALTANTTRNYALQPSTLLKEVVVKAERLNSVQSSRMSALDIPVEQLKQVPVLFGEADIVKAIQLLPGVQSGNEGTGGMYVRGGGPDENLFLLDGVPLYNINHLGGFFSAFNSDAVKNVTLYKGCFPARFGGRLSSILDVTTNNGSAKRFGGTASLGLITGKISLEGPVGSENTTFSVSARRTFADLLLLPVVKYLGRKNANLSNIDAGYYFYDINAKVTHRFDDKNRLYATFYLGNDDVYTKVRTTTSLNEDQYLNYKNGWGNVVGGLRWNRAIGPKLFMNLSASYTQYRNAITTGTEKVAQFKDGSEQTSVMSGDYNSAIRDLIGRIDFQYAPSTSHGVQFGGQYTRHWFQPNVASASIDYYDQVQMNQAWKMDTSLSEGLIPANEITLFAEDDWTVSKVVRINYGLNLSGFGVEESFYPSAQPRVSARFLITEDLSVKAGYAYMSQYLHLLSTTSISLPTDLWVPSTNLIPPMKAHQVAAGACYTVANTIDLSVEGYYKRMSNLLEYRDGATAFGSSVGWEQLVCLGDGWTYGAEFLAEKSIGQLTGWIGYTWSRTTHLFNREGQVLNNGKPFPAKYDRRHDINIVLNYKINEKIDISANWVFCTGNTATLALEKYPVATSDPEEYNRAMTLTNSLSYVSGRNNLRMPNYHRADIGVNFHRRFKRPNCRRTINVSIYNLYNRQNPYLTYTSTEYSYNGYSKALVQLSIFPILPSVAYTLHF